MFLAENGEYSSILELMHYFYFEFNVYIILLMIIVINFMKIFLEYRKSLQHNGDISIHSTDMITSLLCVIAMGNALYLQGVISDISNEASEIWFHRVFVICIVSFILFVLQCYIYRYSRLNKIRKRHQFYMD